MPGRNSTSRAFTLVELLCVISVLVLLIMMLVPILASARGLAHRMQCLANQKSIAAAVLGFAAEHEGRAPGMGMSLTNYSPIDWIRILNVEYFKATGQTSGIYSGMVTKRMPKGVLTCPCARMYGSWGGVYPYQLNDDVNGGDGPVSEEWQYWYPSPCEFDANFPHDFPYSKPVEPSAVQPMYNAYNTIVGWYNMGARVMSFPRPGYTYMMTEGEYPCMSNWGWIPWGPTGSPATTLNARPSGAVSDTNIPPWSGDNTKMSTFYGFRHTLPADYALYQAKASACFTFVDGHVEAMTANVPDQNQYFRLRMK